MLLMGILFHFHPDSMSDNNSFTLEQYQSTMDGVDIYLAQECVMQKSCSFFVFVFSLVLFSFDLSAQTTATKKAVIKPDSIPGYKTMMIDGFTLLVHEKVLDPKNSEMFNSGMERRRVP